MNVPHTGPLSGIKVIEFTHWLAAPYCGNILSDFGANVIKVEPLIGDQVRQANGEYLYSAFNHGKRGISIDLKKEQGRKIALDLLKEADVLIENFRPGVMEKIGIGYEEVSKINPGIVYCSISAFGNTTNYVNRPGMDPIVQGMGAVMSMTGQDENSPPLLPGIPIADNSAAFMSFGAISSALYEREKSGKGQKIDLNLIDMMVLNLTTRYGQYLATGENPKPLGNQHSQVFPYQAFPTKDGWMTAGAQTDKLWGNFCKLIGRPDLSQHEKYKTNAKRIKHRKELTEILNEVFMEKTTEEWCSLFEGENILFGPIWGIHELINSDLIQDHNIVVDVEHPSLGNIPIVQTPVTFSRSRVEIQPILHLLGEHTKEILEELGYDNETISRLATDKIIKFAEEKITIGE